jgi:hypothetical protein
VPVPHANALLPHEKCSYQVHCLLQFPAFAGQPPVVSVVPLFYRQPPVFFFA